jgi:CRISPR-associated protein Csb2
MIGLQVRFLAGRYHANAWHHAHNEAVPEWPPSPWRVLRALVSAAYAEELAPEVVAPLLEQLRGLPCYCLPRASDAHSRHYMPDTDDGSHSKAKVFDTFVAVEGGAIDPRPLTIAWDVELSEDDRRLLERLARRIPYLGRAESWASLDVVSVAQDTSWDCWPEGARDGASSTNLLAVASQDTLTRWADEQPKPTKKQPPVPRSLWDVVTFSGERYRAEGWSDVPGTRRVRYVFREPPFRRTPSTTARVRTKAPPTVARFAIRSPVLPRMFDAIAIGERLREAAMSQSREVSGDARPVFSGHMSSVSNHQHARYLATNEGPRHGFIDHLTIAAESGFEPEDIIALQRLRRLWGRGGHDLELILIGLGQPSDFAGDAAPRSRILGRSTVWESVTPYVPTRHPKRVRGVLVDGIEDQVVKECRQVLGVTPSSVVRSGEPATWARFRRRRLKGNGSHGPDLGVGVRIILDRPRSGPLALGYGSHFGLGLFEPRLDA